MIAQFTDTLLRLDDFKILDILRYISDAALIEGAQREYCGAEPDMSDLTREAVAIMFSIRPRLSCTSATFALLNSISTDGIFCDGELTNLFFHNKTLVSGTPAGDRRLFLERIRCPNPCSPSCSPTFRVPSPNPSAALTVAAIRSSMVDTPSIAL
ncbi:hypothetical protein OSTOST_05114 [Ostertagia ostertagi]